MKQSTFNSFVLETISNDYVHFFLIMFEYLFCIFPSTANAGIKIYLHNTPKAEYLSNTTSINSMMLFKYLRPTDNTLSPIIVISIISILLLLYAFIYFIGAFKSKLPNVLQYIIANIYDLIIFRYFSIIALDASVFLLFNYLYSTLFPNNLIAIIFLLFFIVFAFANYSFILQCGVCMNIANPQLVDNEKKYSYDQISKEYDLILLLLKIFIAIETNYLHHVNEINIPIISLNIMIILLNAALFIWLFIVNSFINWSLTYSYANIRLNALRKGISFFNALHLCLEIFFFDKQVTTLNIFILAALALNATVIMLYFESALSKNHLSSIDNVTYEIILLMMILNHNDKDVRLQLKLIQNSYMRNHKKKCRQSIDEASNNINSSMPMTSTINMTGPCFLCKHYSDSNDKLVNNILVLYKYLKSLEIINASFSREMVKLFYYKIHKKTFKYHRYYYLLINKYKQTNKNYIRNISLICNKWFKKDNEDNDKALIQYLFEVNAIEGKVIDLLNNMHTFLSQSIELKNAETIVKLSSELSNTTISIRSLLKNSNTSMTLYSQVDPLFKIINGFLIYHMDILRYIIETLINQPLSTLLPLNIENFDDFLLLHFNSDQIIICSVDLSSIFHQDIQIIKITKSFVNYESQCKLLSEYFPIEIQKEGIELFNHEINSMTSDDSKSIKSASKTFKFPFIRKSFIQYIKYSFFVSTIPKSSSMLIYGQFFRLKQKCLLLNFNQPKIVIAAYCKEFCGLLRLKRQWLLSFQEINIVFYLENIFKLIKDERSAEAKDKDKNNDNCNAIHKYKDINKIECQFSYKYYLEHFSYAFHEIRSLDSFKANPENEIILNSTIDKMNKHTGEPIKIILEKMCEYTKGICLYEFKIQNILQTTNITKKKNNNDDASDDQLQDHNNLLYNIHSTTHSASTLSNEQSLSSFNQSKSTINSEYQIINNELQNQIIQKVKKLSIFTLLMLGLNIILIIICIVFLFTQINQTTQLSASSNILFYFKSLRWVVVNVFLSIVTTICYSKTPFEDESESVCVNGYRQYSNYFKSFSNMPSQYDLLEFAIEELKFNAEFGQTSLLNFKRMSESLSNLNSQRLLETEMTYYEFTEDVNGENLMSINITFEEGLRKYINTVLVLTDKTINDGSYDKIPIYFLNYEKGTYTFPKTITKNLGKQQREIYKGITNYMNFVYSFSIGDAQLETQFNELGNSNNVMNIIFMITIALFNLILFILCKKNIETAYYIFKVLISNMIEQSEKQENSKSLVRKVENLQLLAKFYKKNPNSIIKVITKEKFLMQSQVKAKAHQMAINEYNSSENNFNKSNGSGSGCNGRNKPQLFSFGYQFHDFLLRDLIRILYLVFGVFFIIIIIFDIVLLLQFQSMLSKFNYSLLYYNSDHSTMTNAALIGLYYVANISNSDLVLLLGENTSTDTNEILNTKLKENHMHYDQLLLYNHLNSSQYPKFEQHFNYTCQGLFLSINESFIMRVSESLKKDYNIANEYICKSLDLLHVPYFDYLRGDLISRSISVLNKRSKRAYDDIYAFFNDNELYTLYMLLLMIFRPISNHFKSTILIPELNSSFSFFVVLVGVYLATNIILEIVLFVTVKWGISKRLTRIQKDLYLLNNCLN